MPQVPNPQIPLQRQLSIKLAQSDYANNYNQWGPTTCTMHVPSPLLRDGHPGFKVLMSHKCKPRFLF